MNESLVVFYNFVNNTNFVLIFILFLIISYIIIALLTRSFNKSLAYLGVSFVLIGFFLLFFKYILPQLINNLGIFTSLNIPSNLLNSLLSPLFKSGIYSFLCGFILIGLYVFNQKIKKEKQSISKSTEQNINK